MIKFATNILFATDFSESAGPAFCHSLEWATGLDASLTLVNVQSIQLGIDVDASVSQRFLDEQRERAKTQLDRLLTETRRQVPSAAAQHLTGMPYEQICQIARDKHCDLIIMGTHGWSGIDRVLFGSVAERVIAHAPCPVLSIPLRKAEDIAAMHTLSPIPRHIILPLDFSECSLEAYEFAVQIAKWFDSALTLVYAIEPLTYSLDFTLTHPLQDKANRKKMQDRLVELTEVLIKEGMTAEYEILEKPAMEATLETSTTRQADLIVMGTHGRKGLSKFVMGSITGKVLRHSPYPVLTVKSPKFEGGHYPRPDSEQTANVKE
ncbi:MAG: universal stress protein [Nitrospirales bacterium]|nr:universal stress protein [Nitrospirales bacterium]